MEIFFFEARDVGLEQIKRNDPMNEIIIFLLSIYIFMFPLTRRRAGLYLYTE